jgi:hypothetical protein
MERLMSVVMPALKSVQRVAQVTPGDQNIVGNSNALMHVPLLTLLIGLMMIDLINVVY